MTVRLHDWQPLRFRSPMYTGPFEMWRDRFLNCNLVKNSDDVCGLCAFNWRSLQEFYVPLKATTTTGQLMLKLLPCRMVMHPSKAAYKCELDSSDALLLCHFACKNCTVGSFPCDACSYNLGQINSALKQLKRPRKDRESGQIVVDYQQLPAYICKAAGRGKVPPPEPPLTGPEVSGVDSMEVERVVEDTSAITL